MRRRHLLAALLLAIPASAIPQEEQVIDWTWNAVAAPGQADQKRYDLHFKGSIASGYIVYGSDFEVDIGPRPVRLKFDAPEVTAQGSLQSAGTRRRLDPVFKGEYSYFQGTAQLSQQIAVKGGVSRVTGTIRGQTCREADGTCSLFSRRFEIDLP